MYITNLAFLDYLRGMAQFRSSIVYHDFITVQLTRTIESCFAGL